MTSTYRIVSASLFIDRQDRRTLQVQLATSIVSTILDTGALPGTRLPSIRNLATTLKISKSIVILVYQDLVAQGYIEPEPRSGFVVSKNVPHRRVQYPAAAPGTDPQVDWSNRLAQRLDQRRRIQKPRDWRTYTYPFIYGQVDPKLFDHNAWRDCIRRSSGQRDFHELADDRLAQDDPILVDYIRRNTLTRRGIRASSNEVLITLGAQNALWIAATLLASRDRLGVMENPGFPDFAEVLRFLGMPHYFINGDDHGLDPDLLPLRTGLVFVTPSHSIPTGATLPRFRRQRLLELAIQRDFVIIEDDYETEMNFLEPPLPALKAIDSSGRVIYVGSFSKSLFPGLRIGYLVAPEGFIRQARELRTLMLRHAPGHMQRVTGYFLALGYYDAHIVRLRNVLKRRRDAMVTALQSTAFRIEGAARHGGSSLWVAGPEHIDSRRFAEALAPRGVLIEPGHPFFASPSEICNLFRLGYSSIDEAHIAKGIEIMQEVLYSLDR